MLRRLFAAVLLMSCFAFGQALPQPAPPSAPNNTATPAATPESPKDKSPTAAETAEARKERLKMMETWRERAKTLTAEILDERWRLSPELSPILPARLADAWWKLDPTRAKAWLASSVDEVVKAPDNENDEAVKARFDAARTIYPVASKLDHAAGDRVIKAMVEIAERSAKSSKRSVRRSEIGFTLYTSLFEGGRLDAARIEEIGRLQIALGGGTMMDPTFNSLAQKDPARADHLFGEALQAAANDEDGRMTMELVAAAFPAFSVPKMPAYLSETHRLEMLNLLASRALAPVETPEAQQTKCWRFVRDVARLIDRFPPAMAGQLQSEIETCKNLPPDPGASDPSDCPTTDDCLKRANDAKNPEESADRKITAAIRAGQEDEDPERALDILDSLTAAEREARPSWVNDRTNFLYGVIRKHYAAHELAALQSLFERAPDEQRGDAELWFVEVLQQKEDTAYATTMLDQARRTLEKHPAKTAWTYISLVNHYARLIPGDLDQVFRFAVSELDKLEYYDPKKPPSEYKEGAVMYPRPGAGLEPVQLPSTLMEPDDSGVRAVVKTLDHVEDREAFRLGLLAGCMRRYNALAENKTR